MWRNTKILPRPFFSYFLIIGLRKQSEAFHDRDSSSFKTSFKRHVIGLSFEVCNSFLLQLALKLRAVESGSPEKVPGKGAFYYINHHNSGTFFGLTDSTARHFEAN